MAVSYRAEAESVTLNKLFKWAGSDTPGAAVVVIRNDQIVQKWACGLADLQEQIPITGATGFRLASLTKQITAMAAMILAEAGELRYEDSISKFLPAFPDWARSVTVRHLLTHTSGIDDYESLFLQQGKIDREYPSSSKQQHGFQPSFRESIELLSRADLRFSPGEEWEYSNSGYVVLAAIIEAISGQSLGQFLSRNIFRPLSMNDSFLSEDIELSMPGVAKSYEPADAAFRDIDHTPFNAVYGPDGAYSTIDDMAKWCQALGSEQLVSATTLQEGFESGLLNNGAKAGYGFGWYTAENDSQPFVSHTGSWCGFRTLIFGYPDDRSWVVALSNTVTFNDVQRSAVAGALACTYLAKEAKSHVNRAAAQGLTRYAGRYRSQYGEIIDVIVDEGKLMLESASVHLKLEPQSKVRFSVHGAGYDSYFFHEDDDSEIVGVTRHLSLFGYSRDAYTPFFRTSENPARDRKASASPLLMDYGK